jgi:hypothetical protein
VLSCSENGQVHFFSSLSRLKIGDHKRYLRALLYPARFCIVGRPAQLDRSRVTSVASRNNLQIPLRFAYLLPWRKKHAGNPGALLELVNFIFV